MNQLQVFNFNSNEVRTVLIDNEPWFVLKDVCDILGLDQPSRVKDRLNQKGVTTSKVLTNGGLQEANVINESNLYKVIFQSKKPEAESFTEWVTSEVLPSIRKTGSYQVPTDPMQVLKLMFTAMEQSNQRVLAVETQIQEVKDIITIIPDDWRKETTTMINRISQSRGGNQYIREVREESYIALDRRMAVDLGRRLTNKYNRMAGEGASKTKLEALNKLDVIADDKKLIEGYIQIIKEMAIKYGIRKVEA